MAYDTWEMIGWWKNDIYWTFQDMIYSTNWMAEQLVYVATGNWADIHVYPLEQMVTYQAWSYTWNTWCDYYGSCYEYQSW
jgi:hypothetical protein